MAEKEKRNSRNGERTSSKDIQKEFYTNIKDDVANIIDRRTNRVLVQARLSMRCDPLVSTSYMQALARECLKYQKDAIKDIKRNLGLN